MPNILHRTINLNMIFDIVDNPIVLEEDEPSASESEIDCGSLRAGSADADQELFNSTETVRPENSDVSF